MYTISKRLTNIEYNEFNIIDYSYKTLYSFNIGLLYKISIYILIMGLKILFRTIQIINIVITTAAVICII